MFTYTLRTSSRSRHVRLKVSHHSGLEIVVPLRFDISKVPEIIAKKEQWIRRSIEKVQSTIAPPPTEIPTQINFQSIGSLFEVIVEHNSKHKNFFIEKNNRVTLYINTPSKKILFTLLKKWLHQKSRTILLPWLERISKEHGFTYNQPTVRFQKTRWGSCSTKKNINLNRALIFLRPELVEYLMIHELCHTVEMNHSKKFWELLEKHCQNYQALDKELKSASKYIERWVF